MRRKALLISLAVAFVGAVSSSVYAQQGPQGPPIIRDIEIQYVGAGTINKDRILAQLRTKIGKIYSDEVVEQDIRQLYKSGGVQNVRIFAEPVTDGVKVIVAVQTRPVMRELEFVGGDTFKAKRLRKTVALKIHEPIREDELEKARQKIIELYQGRGFNDIEVKYTVEPIESQTGLARVVFNIDEGVKGAVKRIAFEGNTAFSDRTLRKQMKTRGKTLIFFLDKSGRLDEAQLQADVGSVREWYQNHGYADVEVKEVRKERTGKGPLNITLVVSEGNKYHVGRITVTGEKVTSEEKIRLLLKMKEGSVYSPKDLREDAKAIVDAYGSGGYVDLSLVPEGTSGGTGVINLDYKIDEGNRSFVQRINVVGNTRTKDKVLRREVLIAPGDVFNTVRVETTKKRLENLGFFAKVETYPEETGVPGRKDLTVQVEEKRTGSLNFGVGFSTIDSLLGFVELTQGNFDLMNWPSFTGGGQKFRARVQYGTRRRDLVLGITEPWFLEQRLSLGGEAYFREANFLSSVYDQRNYGFSVTARKPLFPFTYVSLTYGLENIEIFNIPLGASPSIKAEEGTNTKSVVIPSLVFDRRDNPFLTRRGQRIQFTPYIAGGFLGGDVQIFGGSIEASQYFHLPWDLVLLLNGEVATVDNWGDAESVRIFDRLFLGGSNNLRGFEFRDIGPRDEDGEPLGGKTMMRSTVEVTFPIVIKARGAFFYDSGFVNEKHYDWDPDHYASDAGFGLRLDLPIGPLRVDYGIPIRKDGRSGSGKFNFNVGYQF